MGQARKRLVIVGASGHGIAALDTAHAMDRFEIVGWLDSFKTPGESIAGLKVLGGPDNIAVLMTQHGFDSVFLGISNNYTRRLVWERIRASAPALSLESVIHPFSCIARSARIGKGSLVMAGAVVNAGATVGENCIVNTKVSLDHDSTMQDYSSLLPGVTTGGDVNVGLCSCVCLNAALSHRVSVGNHSYVGAGSLVLRDIPDYSLAYGMPAKVVRSREEAEKHF